MEQAAISCESATGAHERIERLVSELSGDPPKGRIVAQGVHRTCRVNSCGSSLLGHPLVGKEFIVSTRDGVVNDEILMPFAILNGEIVKHLLLEPGCVGTRNLTAVGPGGILSHHARPPACHLQDDHGPGRGSHASEAGLTLQYLEQRSTYVNSASNIRQVIQNISEALFVFDR